MKLNCKNCRKQKEVHPYFMKCLKFIPSEEDYFKDGGAYDYAEKKLLEKEEGCGCNKKGPVYEECPSCSKSMKTNESQISNNSPLSAEDDTEPDVSSVLTNSSDSGFFILSEKMFKVKAYGDDKGRFASEDVKEFIRLLKEEIGELIVSEVGEVNAHRHSDEIIDKLTGSLK